MTSIITATLSEQGKALKWHELKTKFCGWANLDAALISSRNNKAYGTPTCTGIASRKSLESVLSKVRKGTPSRLANPIITPIIDYENNPSKVF